MISSKTLKSQVLILFHIPGSLFPVNIKTDRHPQSSQDL